jgi:DNA polymerase-1
MYSTNQIFISDLLKSPKEQVFSLVYEAQQDLLSDGLFLVGFIKDEVLNYTKVELEDLKKLAGRGVFTYESKEVYKLFENTLEAPVLLDLKLGAYIENSNLPFQFEDFHRRFSLETFAKEDFGGNIELAKLWHSDQLGRHFMQNLDSRLLNLWQNVESPLARVLAVMENTGIYIDQTKLQEISNQLSGETERLDSEIKAILQVENLNLNSPSQLGPALVNFGLAIKPKSSGKIPTDKDILESLVPLDKSGVVAKILDYRTVTKLNSTFAVSFLGKLDKNSRIHGIFSQTGAATGRISSNSPNLQNIPIKHPKYGPLLRACIASEPSKLIISADYSQIELRLLAHFTSDPVLKAAFENDEDVHARTASEIFEIPLDSVTKEQRNVGKTLNFALLYQQGPQATGKQLGISTKEASQIIAKYFQKFAKVRPYLDSNLEFARKNGFVETFLGRRRYFDNLNSTNGFLRSMEERAVCNSPLQGSNADLIKLAMINLQNRIEKENLPAKIVLTVHDELVVETDKDFAQKMLQILITEMELGQPLNVPIKVEAGVGANWSEAK